MRNHAERSSILLPKKGNSMDQNILKGNVGSEKIINVCFVALVAFKSTGLER
jgi:hypothetical protein